MHLAGVAMLPAQNQTFQRFTLDMDIPTQGAAPPHVDQLRLVAANNS